MEWLTTSAQAWTSKKSSLCRLLNLTFIFFNRRCCVSYWLSGCVLPNSWKPDRKHLSRFHSLQTPVLSLTPPSPLCPHRPTTCLSCFLQNLTFPALFLLSVICAVIAPGSAIAARKNLRDRTLREQLYSTPFPLSYLIRLWGHVIGMPASLGLMMHGAVASG